jgi:hypothetical protein
MHFILLEKIRGQNVWFCRVRRIARKHAVINDQFRSPRTEMLLGGEDDTWVSKRENGILYSFDMSKSMFARGNITEKLRIAKAGRTYSFFLVDLMLYLGLSVCFGRLETKRYWPPKRLERINNPRYMKKK